MPSAFVASAPTSDVLWLKRIVAALLVPGLIAVLRRSFTIRRSAQLTPLPHPFSAVGSLARLLGVQLLIGALEAEALKQTLMSKKFIQ